MLHPPVDTEFFTPGGGPSGDYFLVASALVPYKRIDRAIDAANLLGVPLRIAGDGPESARLRAIAGPNVEFLGPVDRPTLREAYRGAAAVLLPGEEDFGIVPVEAMACGRPVIGLARGGVLETVIPEVTGVLVEDESPQAFAEAMRRLRQMRFDTDVIRRHAEPFGSARFDVAFATLLEDTLAARTPC